MYQLLHNACAELIDGLGWHAAADGAVSIDASNVFVANTFFRSLMPYRDYDRRELSALSKREVSLQSVVFARPRTSEPSVKTEPESDEVARTATTTTDAKPPVSIMGKRKRDESGGAQRPATNIISLSEMPEVQVKIEETKTLGADATATTVSDSNAAEVRLAMAKGAIEATAAIRARLASVFMRDARIARSDISKLARTIVVLLLEPISLRVVSVIQRPDGELMARETARLRTGAPPSVDDRRAMNRHVLTLSVNLFAGCPEFALDLVKLEQPQVLRAVYFMVVFSALLFATSVETATSHVLDDFRHNGELERLVERGALVGRTLCALLRGVDVAYRLTLRKRLLMALDAAMSEVAAMRQPYNASPANIERLLAARRMVNEYDLA